MVVAVIASKRTIVEHSYLTDELTVLSSDFQL